MPVGGTLMLFLAASLNEICPEKLKQHFGEIA
jgi:hypothetical protein